MTKKKDRDSAQSETSGSARPASAPTTISHSSDSHNPELRSSEVVLIIDDEEMVRTACSGILSRAGYRVLTAADGKSGIDLFDQVSSETRCVMLDLSMPYLRGNVVFARLKAIDPNVPVFVMSGFCDDQIVRDFTAAGVSGFVHKPFEPEMLVEAVRSARQTLPRAGNL